MRAGCHRTICRLVEPSCLLLLEDVHTLLFRLLHAIHAVLTHRLFAESSCEISFFLLCRALGFWAEVDPGPSSPSAPFSRGSGSIERQLEEGQTLTSIGNALFQLFPSPLRTRAPGFGSDIR